MLDIYAKSFMEASRFTSYTRPSLQTQKHLDRQAEKRERHARLWWRAPYWV